MYFMNYTKRAISGFSWQTVLKFSTYFLSMVKIYFLARLLDPSDFGLFSLVAVALGISESITQTGVNLTILQSKHSVKYFLNTAWVIAIVRGFIIGSLMILLGIGIRHTHNEPKLITITALAALIPVIKGFINPYIVIMHKKMMFFQDTIYRFSFLAVEILMSIAFGFWLKSAYALVWAMISSAIFEVIISFIFFKEKPVFEYIHSRAKMIFANTKWLSIGSLFNYLNENLDDFVIGKITSTYALGIYHNAYSLTHKANYQFSKSVHHGTIPIFTRMTGDLPRLRKAFFKTLGAYVLIVSLVSAPFFVFPELIVELLMGEKWLEAVPLMVPLVLAGITHGIIAVCYTLFLAKKKYKFLNLHLVFNLVLMTTLIIILGQRTGLSGSVQGILISRLCSLPLALAAVAYYLGIKPNKILKIFARKK